MLLIPQLVCLKLPDPAVAALLCRDVLFQVHGTGQNRKVQSDNGAVFPDNPALWRHHAVRKDLFSKQRMSLHGRRDWLPAEFKDSRRYVDIFRKEGIRLSGGLLSGIFDKQGNFDERIVEMPKLESKGSG